MGASSTKKSKKKSKSASNNPTDEKEEESDSNYQVSRKILNPYVKVILQGLCDENCVLSKLNGVPHVLQIIWNHIKSHWKKHVIVKPEIPTIYWEYGESCAKYGYNLFHVNLTSELSIDFPPAKHLNINMLPFIMERKFKKCGLPSQFKSYWENIIKWCYQKSEHGKICYLTIHESFVASNKSQRRPGLHTETPGTFRLDETFDSCYKGKGASGIRIHWGRGNSLCDNDLKGGIYMASTVNESCRIWNCQLIPDSDDNEIIGHLGDVEHLREFLPESVMMEKNTLHWITDRTPHESLPLKKGTYRQFFRLVTSELSLWYEDYSTKNPLGIVPDPKVTRIVKGNKFSGEVCVCA